MTGVWFMISLVKYAHSELEWPTNFSQAPPLECKRVFPFECYIYGVGLHSL